MAFFSGDFQFSQIPLLMDDPPHGQVLKASTMVFRTGRAGVLALSHQVSDP